MKIYSRYKIVGGFGLLLAISVLSILATFKLLTSPTAMGNKIDSSNHPNLLLIYGILIGLNLLILTLFATQNKFIIVDEESITFINPLIPFLRRKYLWISFDYYVLVEEYSKHTTHEAVWLIKDKKIKARFSSFYYSNYERLKSGIHTVNHGKKQLFPIQQSFILMGLKKLND